MSTLTLMPPGTVDEATAENLNSIFVPIAEKARALIVKGSVLTITDPTEVSKMKLARTMRLELKDIRVDLEKRRKALKDESLRKGQAIDSAAATIRVLIEDCEQHLLDQEKFAENIEKARIAEMVQKRTSELHALEVNPANFNLAEMSEDDYDELWTNSSRAKREREEAAKKAESERLARVKSDREEQDRVRAENARLKAQADLHEMVRQEIHGIQQQAMIARIGRLGVRKGGTIECIKETLAETEAWPIDERLGQFRQGAQVAKDTAIQSIRSLLESEMEKARDEATAAKEREEAAKKLRAEQEKARKEREAAALAAEAARAEQEAKLAAEKAKHDAEMKRIKDEAYAKAAKAKAAADIASKEAAEEARKLREKLIALAEQLRAMKSPNFETARAMAVIQEFSDRLLSLAEYIEEEASKL